MTNKKEAIQIPIKNMLYNREVMKTETDRRLQQLRTLSTLLDSKFEGPYGIRFGLDGILGFVPFIGDIITTLLSFSILVSAANLGATPSTLIRMSLNILFENLIDMIPFAGSVFDLWFQSNNRNLRILEAHLQNPEKVSAASRIIVLLVVFLMLIVMFLVVYLSWMILQFFIGLFS